MSDVRLAPGAHVHLVGIGGAGMSALARILLERGHTVSGSDLRSGRATAGLVAMGARVAVGHAAGHVDGADLVVITSAVGAANPELARARELGIAVLPRAALLELVMDGYRRVLVTGTHGKTTTSSMVAVALQAAGMDPSFAIGGSLHGAGQSAHHGAGDVFVAEADEAYRSFLHLTPDVAVVTNAEMEHHDEYADEAAVLAAFAQFLARRPLGGTALLCADDAGSVGLAAAADGDVRTYGEAQDADLRITGVVLDPDGGRFALTDRGTDLGPFAIKLAGRHNVLNAAAAVGAACAVGADLDAVRAGLADFTGTQRRFQVLGEARGVTVVDDYGHHPTEVAATLAAARQSHPVGRIVVVFQPHRYSRTAALGRDLGRALAAADVVVVTDVYPAGEEPVPGVTGALVADAAREDGAADVHLVGFTGDLPEAVASLARPGDLVLTMGAGDITEVGPVLLRRLEVPV